MPKTNPPPLQLGRNNHHHHHHTTIQSEKCFLSSARTIIILIYITLSNVTLCSNVTQAKVTKQLRIWSQSRSLFCHQSASCDHSQPTNTMQIQVQIQIQFYKSAHTSVQTQFLVTTVSQPMQCTLQDVLDMDQSSRGVSDSGFT